MIEEYDPFYIRPDQKESLKKYPYLKSYVESYIENEGSADEIGKITKLTYFFKIMFMRHDFNMQALFEWDDDTTEDFFNWGHNSRWANTFEGQMEGFLEGYVDAALYLADTYGDIDLDNLGDESY